MRLVFYLCLGRFNFVEPVILGWYRLGHGKGDRMADLAACLADPVIFAEAFLGWKAHPHQAEWLRGSTKQLNWCRAGNRWGKTESIAIKHLWKCVFRKRVQPSDRPYVTANTALSLDQARLALSKALRMIEANPEFKKAFFKRYVMTPFPRLEFRNGSIWWARSTIKQGKYLHGYDYDYVSNDEGSQDKDLGLVIDEVLQMRLLDRGGQLDCISTGKRGSEFNRRFAEARNSQAQFAYQGSSTDNPHIDQGALAELMKTMPKALAEERILGGERSSEARIQADWIQRSVSAWQGLQQPVSGHTYISGWDLARKRDHTVGITLDISVLPYQLVAFERFQERSLSLERSYWDWVYDRIRQRWQLYGGQTIVDATGLGEVIGEALKDIGAEAIIFSASKVRELISNMELAFALDRVSVGDLHQDHWRLGWELEQVEDSLGGLDGATALALALFPLRIQQSSLRVSPRVIGF